MTPAETPAMMPVMTFAVIADAFILTLLCRTPQAWLGLTSGSTSTPGSTFAIETAARNLVAADETVTITHTAVSDDTNYDGTTISDLIVTVIDNDTPQVTGVWTQPGDRQLVVNWTATDKATGYKVQWKAPGGNYNTNTRMATITSGSTTTYTIPNLTNGTEYQVRVTATRTGYSDGQPSNEVTGTPNATP